MDSDKNLSYASQNFVYNRDILKELCMNAIIEYFQFLSAVLSHHLTTTFDPDQLKYQLIEFVEARWNKMPNILHDESTIVNEFYDLLDDVHFTAYFSFFCFNKHPILLSSILEHHIKKLIEFANYILSNYIEVFENN